MSLVCFLLFFTEGESPEKALEPRSGSAVKFEKGLATTEGEVLAPAEETGDQLDGLWCSLSIKYQNS